MNKQAASNLLEYALILSIVTVALFAMQTYFRRGIQGIIKVVADDMGPQGENLTVGGGEVKRQLEAAVKSHYNYDHKTTYTMMGDQTSDASMLGQGQIETRPVSTFTTDETSYGILDEGKYHKAADKINFGIPPSGVIDDIVKK